MYFPEDSQRIHSHWMKTVKQFDGVAVKNGHYCMDQYCKRSYLTYSHLVQKYI